MSRYIDADALIESIKNTADLGGWIGEALYQIKQVAIKYIDSAPSIDIEPKRGEWKPFDLTWGRSIWYCTACEESVKAPCDIWTHKPIYNYCPNCGADMRGKDDD